METYKIIEQGKNVKIIFFFLRGEGPKGTCPKKTRKKKKIRERVKLSRFL